MTTRQTPPRASDAYRLRPVVRLLPDTVLVLEVVGQRVRFLQPDGHVADLHRDAFRGLYERADQEQQP